MKIELKSLSDTEELASKLAKNLQGGDVIGLIGELGAGKTTFTQALARALGVKRVVKSPTFTVLQTYKLNSKFRTLCHVDAYRINDPKELEAMGFFDYINDNKTITIIEWADKILEVLPKESLILKLKTTSNKRIATLTKK
jgi:tRNA threonylcarbamoyladenosine biosynthesis protein TsaE